MAGRAGGDAGRDGAGEQAQVITRALDELPDHFGPEVRALAEERLVAEAGSFGPKSCG